MRIRIPSLALGLGVLLAVSACDTAETSADLTAPGGPVLANAISGAIFTTEMVCDGTNVNIFASKEEVYLDGGPRREGSAGLPPGLYWAQVTAPNGVLLGRSPAADLLVNAAGEFDACYSLWNDLRKASDGTVGYDDTPNAGGEYKVWITPADAFDPTTDAGFDPSQSKTDNFKVDANPPDVPEEGTLTVRKFYDANANGAYDAGEVWLADWLVEISGYGDQLTPFSQVVPAGTYDVAEYMPTEMNWVATLGGPFTVAVTDGNETTVDFGNYCTTPSGGKTIGFWSNRNGQRAFEALAGPTALASLAALNLRNGDGSAFDPATYAAFRTWLLGATATNMQYMLSAQLAAMHLNVRAGYVSGDAFVAGYGGTITELMAEADAALADGSTATRDEMEALKDYLDALNNNGPVVSPTACTYTFTL